MERVEAFLRERYGTELSLEPLNAGGWSQAYLLRRHGERLVVRVSATDQNFERDRLAWQLAGGHLPIPRILDLVELPGGTNGEAGELDVATRRHGEGAAGDAPAPLYVAVSEFAEGDHFEIGDARSIERLQGSIVELCRGLYFTDLTSCAGYGYWDATGAGAHASWPAFIGDVSEDRSNASNLIHGWRARLAQSTEALTRFSRLYRELEKLLPYLPEHRNLIHSDLLNFNVLARANTITAVLDWGSSKFGDALYDLAWFEFYEPWYPTFREVHLVETMRSAYQEFMSDTAHLDERLLAYKIHIGLDSMAYNAYRDDLPHCLEAERRTREILRGDDGHRNES